MAFTLPNVAVAGFPDQAEPDSVDIDILTAGHSITGVVSGCAVTAQGVPDMTVAVASGTVSILGVNAAVTSGNVTVAAAHATLPRKDIVVASSAGAKSVVTGTAAAQPLKPAVPAASVALAEVYVPANDAAISSNQITDKRVIVLAATQTTMRLLVTKTTDESLSSNAVLQNDDQLLRSVLANEVWQFQWRILFNASTVGDFRVGWTFPASRHTFHTSLIDAAGGQVVYMEDSGAAATSHSAFVCNGPSTGQRLWVIEAVLAVGGAGGTYQLQWAQGTSNATATTVKAKSTLWGTLL